MGVDGRNPPVRAGEPHFPEPLLEPVVLILWASVGAWTQPSPGHTVLVSFASHSAFRKAVPRGSGNSITVAGPTSRFPLGPAESSP